MNSTEHIFLRAGFSSCSSSLCIRDQEDLLKINQILKDCGLNPVLPVKTEVLLNPQQNSGKRKAEDLNALWSRHDLKYIFDISGGDTCNEILDHLDFDVIRDSQIVFSGYSDLTTLINAVYSLTGKASLLFQVANLIRGADTIRISEFQNFISSPEENLTLVSPEGAFLRGSFMQGAVVGGNVRCFLKLSGTRYFPDCQDKILLLEARSGGRSQIISYFSQLRSMGVFTKISGLVLGEFTQYEKDPASQLFSEIVAGFIPESLPVFKTGQIGHNVNARGIMIGQKYCFRDNGGYPV